MDWKVFQTDVLDALKQYEGYFDFFEKTGTLSDNSRPDCVARVTRERETVWIFDAKNKAEISEKDEERMEKYISQIKSNPLDIGLDHSELGEHSIEPVFITRGEASTKYNSLSSKKLHQFLRKELIYTETNRVVRDVAQMTEKKALTHNQARLLYRSLKEFKDRMDYGRKMLKEVESNFTGLKLKEHPLEGRESLPVDFVLEHSERPSVYIDVPYKDDEEKGVSNFLDEDEIYVSLGSSGKYGCPFEEFEELLMRKLGILSWEKVADLYTPKIPTERTFNSNSVLVTAENMDFQVEIRSKNDTEFKVQALMPEKSLKKLKDQSLNARKEFGEIENGRFKHEFKVTEDLEISYSVKEDLDSYRDTVNSIYQASINPVLSKKVSHN